MRWRSGRLAVAAAAFVAVALTAGCEKKPTQDGPDAGQPPIIGGGGSDAGDSDAGVILIEAIADLRVDTNRDGVVSLEDDSDVEGKADWTAERGAIFLANIDDDDGRCTYAPQMSDAELAACNDAQDTIVNGEDDLLDLAIIKTVPWPQAKDGSYGQLFVSEPAFEKVRLFKKTGGGFVEYPAEEPLIAGELREGAEFAIEGKDIVRDDTVWDGFVDLRWEVTWKEADGTQKKKSDTVRMRVAPVMLHHHLQPSEQVFVADLTWGGTETLQFQSAIQGSVTAAGTPDGLYRHRTDDSWTQDYFETGWTSMPKAGGGQHVMRVNFRSADPNRDPQAPANQPLREAGRIVFQLRGKDVAAVAEYTPGRHTHPLQGEMVTLDAFGNTETIPPYEFEGESYPFGRVLRGSSSRFYTDPKFTRMLESQQVQKPVYVDTSWLLVAHIDETISFLKVNSPRGWVVLANDARLAKQMLEDEVAKGNGNVPMFVGKKTYSDRPPYGLTVDVEKTISEVLGDDVTLNVMDASAHAAVEVDAQLKVIKDATGVTDAEIIPIPFLHEELGGSSVAYQPGMVNMLVIDDRTLAIADPFGPVIDGKDIFKAHVEASLEPLGYSIHWVDDWYLYHIALGEVHCATNATRAIPANKWWESGR